MADLPAATTRPVLVLYASADESFVRGFLLPALGPAPVPAPDPAAGPGAHRVPVIDARNLATIAIAELEQALEASGITIAVITPAFLTDPWSRLSETLATSAAIEGDLNVIPLVLEDCTLPLHIKSKVRLDFRSHDDWDHEAKRLRDYLARPAPAEVPLPCPYPGMRPFEAADAKYFHGRDTEIDAVIALVTGGEREIYVVGPSGSGKSSLIGAGVLPRLAAQPGAAELVVHTMRPGDAPVRRLAACLEVPEAGPTTTLDAAAVAAWAARHAGARLVVFVDQLEELFTQAPPGEQDRFAVALRALRDEPRCLLVLAVRADFYAELLQSQLWLDGRRRHVDLPPLRGAGLRAAIELPARTLEVYFEPGLIERLLADAAGEPGVLPLVQETLVQLWSRRRHQLLTLAAYEALGDGGRTGLAVAISSRADRCLREMTPAQAVIARRLLLRLVSFGEGRPNTRRRQTRAELAAGESPAELDGVLRLLVAARLVTMDGDDRSEDDQVDLCHEVLITAWPSFAAWVEARRADEQRRRQIQASADEWISRGRGTSGLLDEGELATAIAWRLTDAARELGESPEITALVAASGDALARSRARWRRGIAGVCAGLAVFAAVTATLAVIARGQANVADAAREKAEVERATAEVERGKAELERRAAVRLLGEQYRDAGRQAVVEGHFQRAIPYLVAAREQGVDDAGLRMLFRAATRSAVAVSLHHGEPVTSARFSSDGARTVTASTDGTARLWDAATGAPLTPPLVHARPVRDATIAADGTRILTISDDNTAWIWDVTSSPSPPIAIHHAGRINAATFSADGAVIVTASSDKTARLWSARTGAPLGAPFVHDAPVMNAELSRDGSRIVTTVTEGMTAAIWNAKTGARIAPLMQDPWTVEAVAIPRAHIALVSSATFSPDGARIVTTSFDQSALIWDAATGKTLTRPLAHDEGVTYAAFSPDGARIATVSTDGRLRLWDAASGAAAGPALEDASQVVFIAYSHDGTRLLAQCYDKTVRLWDVASGILVATLELESGSMDAAISPDGARVVTASADGLARVWDVRSAAPRTLPATPRVRDAAYSPDGARIATADDTGGLRIWTAAGALEATPSPRLGAINLAFDHDGRQLAAIALDGTAVIMDAGSWKFHPAPREPGERADPSASIDPTIGHAPARASFSPDGRRYGTTGGKNSARVWDSSSGQPVTPPLPHDALVLMIRFSPDGRRVVTASKDSTARVWDAATGTPIGPRLAHPTDRWVTDASFSPDGTRIATVATDNNVRLWDAGSGKLQAVLTGHAGFVISATFSPDGTRLLTHSTDNSARIWNVATGKLAVPPLEHTDQVVSAVWSPDGARVVTTSDKLAQVWDVATGRPLIAPFAHPVYLRDATFSPDGGSVLTAARDTVRIWDTGLDSRSLEDWHRVVRDSSFPQLREALDRLAPASRVAH